MNRCCILQVEDNDNEAILLRRIFDRAGIGNPLQVVTDGEMAIHYLSGTGQFGDRARYPVPHLVLLDLNLPKKNGMEVLAWIREHPVLRRLIVILLTSSDRPEDVRRAYELGANSFIVKPFGLIESMEMAQSLKGWWLSCNRFAPLDEFAPAAHNGELTSR